MDKNTITGFVLIAAVLFGFSWFSRPSEEEIRAQHQQDSIAAVNKAKQENERKQAEAKKIEQAKAVLENQDTTALFYSALNGKAQDIYLPQTKAMRSVMKYVNQTLERYENMSGKEKKENRK